jgi:hypothetical protein
LEFLFEYIPKDIIIHIIFPMMNYDVHKHDYDDKKYKLRDICCCIQIENNDMMNYQELYYERNNYKKIGNAFK